MIARHRQTSTHLKRPYLYAVVFDGTAIKLLVGLLFAFFVLHPAVPVFAADEDAIQTGLAVEQTASETTAAADAPIADDETVEKDTDLIMSGDATASNNNQSDEPSHSSKPQDNEVSDSFEYELGIPVHESEPLVLPVSTISAELDTDGDMAASTNSEVTNSDLETTHSSSSTPEEAEAVGGHYDQSTTTDQASHVAETVESDTAGSQLSTSTDDEVIDAPEFVHDTPASTSTTQFDEGIVAQNVSTSTVEQLSPSTTLESIIEESDLNNPYHFDAADCYAVGTGSYYCKKQTESLPEFVNDEIYEAQDQDGDTEIYVQLRGEVTQLTHNLVDDAAPKFDPIGEVMVWHRLVDDRYQIIRFTFDEEKEMQLTSGTQNNMQPDVYDGRVVWQQWDGQDWEIAYFDGNETHVITNNELPDLAPRINDQFIVWNTAHNGNERAGVVYDIASGQQQIIEDGDDVMVKNPRLILMYEAEFDNGDVVTRGFDIETGKIIPLTASPEDLPDQVPEPDSTGETRALVSTKSNPREGEDVDEPDVITPPVGSTTTPAMSAGSTTIFSTDVVIDGPTNIATSSFDLIIEPTEPVEASSSPVTSNGYIPDVHIPPYNATNTDETQ